MEFPALLKPAHPEYPEVQGLLRRTSSSFQPIWQSPIASHHGAWVSTVAFSPDGQTLASGSWDRTIKLWEVDYVVNFHPNLADYLSRGWCKLDGRKLLWSDSTDNLYKSQMFEYMNVSPFSHIGILRRQLPQPELDKALFWQSLRVPNLDSALVLYERLTTPEVQEDARESLILQLTRAAQTAFHDHTNPLAQWRLKQARSLVKPDETNHRVLETLKEKAELEESLSR